MPGLGISTSDHATRLVLFCNRLQRNIEAFKESAARNEIARPFATQIASLIGVPVRLGVSFEPTGTMLVYDTRSLKADRAWFPRLCFVYRRRPKPSIFPMLRSQREKLSAAWSQWWGRYSREHGITDSRKVFHSFRHTVKRKLRDARVDKSLRDALMGHKADDVAEGYGLDHEGLRVPLPVLAKAVEQIAYKKPERAAGPSERTLLRDARVDKSLRDALMGHKADDVAEGYGLDHEGLRVPLPVLAKAVEQIAYKKPERAAGPSERTLWGHPL